MSSTATFHAGVAASPVSGEFEFQRFDCYRIALEFQALVPRLFPRRGYSAECAAVVDALLARRVIGPTTHRHAHGLLIRVTQMLSKLAQRMRR